ncbi:unnamed protein product [Acanthoscelides obtectus]|uniref:Arginyl-tRNA--protein transferase 1 n=1 Tax=Acanthoscelides obtectus TaxID=200917 RepID=A0A9P0KUZ1_ACAOB|nr:unnamed protein product [Acanthoscelides obtectus]CAK1667622.1 Arginyl-tRNA--protein transferase 1 [Acanthoscelides obtectus]
MSVDLTEKSLVQWFDETERHKCGYCKSPNGSVSIGMWADTLTVEDYQNLIDRGWRRSGKYCYKPTMDETCCPQYTIKCDALHFSLTKSQKKVIKKFNKYLQDGILKKDSECDHVEDEVHRQEHVDFKKDIAAINIGEVKAGFQEGGEISNIDIKDNPIEPENSNVKLNISAPNSEPLNNQTHKSNSCAENPMEQSRPPCKKAKVLRLERKKEKLLKKGLVLEEKTPQAPKTLEQFMEEIPDIAKGKLKIAISRMSKESDSFKVTAQLYQTYQMIIHNDLPDECEEENFCQFLIDSPLQPERVPDGPGYGTFHQQYWIDDKLIAVGVIDILPRCVSSVYFFYDPDYRGLTLGTYGALREVYFTRSLQEHLPHLNSYYMGFYIHSCQKMRYKGRFTPSYLLCPETYQWFPIEQCIKKLEESKYARFVDDIDAIDGYLPSQRDVMHMQVVYKYRLMLFKDLKKIVDETEMFKKIGQLVGKKCANTMVFFIR